MNKRNKLIWAYGLLGVGTLLIILSNPLANALVPWHSMGKQGPMEISVQNPEIVKYWANSLRYLGFIGVALGLVERVLHTLEIRSNSS